MQGGLDDVELDDGVTSPVSPAPQISSQLRHARKQAVQASADDEDTAPEIELDTDSCSVLLRSFNAYLQSTGQQPVSALVEPRKAGPAVQHSTGPGRTSGTTRRGRQYTAQVQSLSRHGMAWCVCVLMRPACQVKRLLAIWTQESGHRED